MTTARIIKQCENSARHCW